MTWLREWATGNTADDADSDKDDEVSANVSHNAPVRRENKKTERERKRLKLIKAEERRLAKLKDEKIRQSNVLRSVVVRLLLLIGDSWTLREWGALCSTLTVYSQTEDFS